MLPSHFCARIFDPAPIEIGKENTLEDLWHAAVLLLGAASTRTQVQLRISYELAFEELQRGVERLSTALNEYALAAAMGQIGSALKGASLHRDVVRQTRLRECAEREQLQKDTLIAQQIQSAILPKVMLVPGFELAALMIPAADVGGDYYDVLPTEHGCWFGIGGDLLVLYTDGVTEASNHVHEQFGMRRLRRVIEESHAQPVEEICTSVIAAVKWGASQDDDMTIFVGRFLGTGNTLRSSN